MVGRGRTGAIAERVVREHGGDLRHAHTGVAGGVPTAPNLDRWYEGAVNAGEFRICVGESRPSGGLWAGRELLRRLPPERFDAHHREC